MEGMMNTPEYNEAIETLAVLVEYALRNAKLEGKSIDDDVITMVVHLIRDRKVKV